MSRYWAWISRSKNQKTLTFIGTGIAVAVSALWVVYKEVYSINQPTPSVAVENACGVAVAPGSVSIAGVTCTFGISLEEYQTELAKQEAALREELAATTAGTEQETALAQQLSVVERRINNIEQAYSERAEKFGLLADALENSAPNEAVNASFMVATESGDTSDLESLLRENSASSMKDAADQTYQLAILLEQKGALAEAYEALTQASAIDPNNDKIIGAIERITPQLDVVLGDGRLRVGAVLSEGSELTDADHAIYAIEQDLDGKRVLIASNYADPSWFTLPAGKYYLQSTKGVASAAVEFQVHPGIDQEAILDLKAGRLRVGAVLSEGGTLVDADHAIYSIEQDLDGNRALISSHYADPSWFTLPTGKYYLQSTMGSASASLEFDVQPGIDQEAILDLGAGRVRMGAVLTEGGELVDADHAIYSIEQDLDGKRDLIASHYADPSWFTLPAGRYYLQSTMGSSWSARELEVVPGIEQEAILVIEQ